ncbi:hypothetical protein WKT02_08615 [Erysipelotrichaceae bacterium HCN-30851]
MDIFIEWVIPIISGAILFELANKFYFKGDREKIKKNLIITGIIIILLLGVIIIL